MSTELLISHGKEESRRENFVNVKFDVEARGIIFNILDVTITSINGNCIIVTFVLKSCEDLPISKRLYMIIKS